MSDFERSAKYENGFWLQILGDHARFIHDSLSPQETEEIQTANQFIQIFDRLLRSIGTTDAQQLSGQAQEEAQKIRSFKLEIIKKLLLGKITIHLSPTFVSHMVNEVEEYIRILEYLKNSETPPVFHELHHHIVWLLDASGHANAINSNLDQVEKKLKQKAEEYTKRFEQFYLKAVELSGYLRTNLTEFPALKRFNQETTLELTLFMNFLHEIEELELSDQALGTFSALMADHMAREECYYLAKVAQSARLKKPDCDPTKPRKEKKK